MELSGFKINGTDIAWEGEGMYYRDLLPTGDDWYAAVYRKCPKDFRGWYEPPVNIGAEELPNFRIVWLKENGRWNAYRAQDAVRRLDLAGMKSANYGDMPQSV